MNRDDRGELTLLIDGARAGCKDSRDRLARAVYGEFHRIADGLLRRERPDHTLQASALVNEAVMKLLDGETLARTPDRRYLLGAAAQAMRQVLVDHARRRAAAKRVEGRSRVPLDDVLAYFEEQHLDVLALNEALDRLAADNERVGLVVVLRFFAGLSVPEVADALNVSTGTVEGDWRFARAWLHDQLGEAAP